MKPDRYESFFDGRKRLSGTLQQRGSRMGLSNAGGLLFGGLFVVVGLCIALVGLKVLPVDPSTVHAPYWVLTAAGCTFASAGIMVLRMAFKQVAASRRRARLKNGSPEGVALADFAWDSKGFVVAEWPAAIKLVIAATVVTVFLSMFNWMAFATPSPGMLKGVVIVFDMLAVLLWGCGFVKVGKAFKFGDSRINFTRFPYSTLEPVMITWQPGKGVEQINGGAITLRCVEEWFESTGKGNDRNSYLVHEEVWSSQGTVNTRHNLSRKDVVELCFALPKDALSTNLSADKPVFWELEVRLDLPGLDFKQRYLVPIYKF